MKKVVQRSTLDEHCDALCDRFEEACKAAGQYGQLPLPEPFLEQAPEGKRSGLLRELTKLGHTYRQRRIQLAQNLKKLSKSLAPLRFLDLIGQGGMAKVYKAEDERGEVVAVKVLPLAFTGDKERRDRFQREAEILARIKHDHIVALHPIQQFEGNLSTYLGKRGQRVFFVMEYASKGNLCSRIRTGGFKPADAIEIILQICQGLKFAHDQRVIHRDIKPANILIDHKGRLKIADFGLAKVLDSQLTRTTQLGMGTQGYMAPEQILSPAAVDHRADIYSVGVVLHELLTGSRPNVVSRQGDSVTMDRCDTWLRDIVLRTIAANPDDRFQRIEELIHAIQLGPQQKSSAERVESASSKEPKTHSFGPGAKVHSRWKRRPKYFRGTVTAIAGLRIHVQYDDGDKEWTTADMIRFQDGSPFITVGVAVEARWKGGQKFYRGRITAIDDKQIHVTYDDGDKEWTSLDFIRLVESPHQFALDTVVQCRWRGGLQYFQGTVTEIDGDRIHIHYDDGAKEWTTAEMLQM